MSYPKWMYHADSAEPLLVQDAEQNEKLPLGWADSPAAALELVVAGPEKPEKPKQRKGKSA